MKHLEVMITGRVQMVMYRDFAQRKALSLGLVGFVKNNTDGSVLVVAEGEEKHLHAFIKYLKKGPVFARIDSMETSWREETESFNSFTIVF